MAKGLRITCIVAAYVLVVAAPFVFFRLLSVDNPGLARFVVGFGKLLGGDLAVLRVQDLVGSAATIVPFYISFFQRDQPYALYIYAAFGVVGYAAYLFAQLKLQERGIAVTLETIFGTDAAQGTTATQALTEIQTVIQLVKLVFFWFAVAALAVKWGLTDKLLAQLKN
jgi:hypothetical protein